MLREGRMNEIHSQDAERFLLLLRRRLQHSTMNHHRTRLLLRRHLILNPQPPMTLIVSLVRLGHHGICKGEKLCRLAAIGIQRQLTLKVLVLQHRLQSLTRDVAEKF